jgi:5'-methylthioadenosine phosphorylase
MPTELNFRANIYALKSIGVEWIISISAVGSLKEELKPLDIVLPDQLIDNTKYRVSTFFGKGMVAHIGFADPFCNVLRKIIYNVAKDMDCSIHMDGTYICIEGPQFSTRADSNMYRAIGCEVIGMTAVPEAKLAREAQMCYATVAMVTDYDVWYEASEDVTVDMVIENLNKNVTTARKIIQGVVKHIPEQRKECGCSTALKDAVITNHEAIPKDVKERLKILFD